MRVAVLGLGSIGMRHAGNLLRLGAQVCGFDPDPARRAALEAQGGEIAMTRDTAIAQSDAALIASPSALHHADLSAAVAAKRPALVEKPLSHDPQDLERLLDAAATQGLRVWGALNLRFHPAVLAAKALLQQKALGDLLWGRLICASYLPDWRPGQDYRQGYAADLRTGGVLFDVIHEFDLAHHLLGPTQAISCQARNTGVLDIASEDCADIVLRHPNGLQSSLHLDYVTRPPLRVTEIAGTLGRITLDLRGRSWEWRDAKGEKRGGETFSSTFDDDYLAEMQAFLDSLAGRATPLCGGHEALAVLKTVIDARKLAGLPQP